jgi:hypothetical protein
LVKGDREGFGEQGGEVSINLDSETIKWITGVSIAAAVPIAIYASRQRFKKREATLGKLTTHFNDMKREVIDHIIGKTANLHIKSDGRLAFGNDSKVYTNYRFEESDLYMCFKVHFPQETEQWETFKNTPRYQTS